MFIGAIYSGVSGVRSHHTILEGQARPFEPCHVNDRTWMLASLSPRHMYNRIRMLASLAVWPPLKNFAKWRHCILHNTYMI